MSVKNAAAKKQVLTEIMKLMDRVGGSRLSSADHPEIEVSETDEPSEDATEMEPKKPAFSWMDGPSDDGGEDDESAPTPDELDAMEAKLAKYRGRK